jgi:hypothetical protein
MKGLVFTAIVMTVFVALALYYDFGNFLRQVLGLDQ